MGLKIKEIKGRPRGWKTPGDAATGLYWKALSLRGAIKEAEWMRSGLPLSEYAFWSQVLHILRMAELKFRNKMR